MQVTIDRGVAKLTWDGDVDPAELMTRADELLERDDVVRVEARIDADDVSARHALHLARFRREGTLRRARMGRDIVVYSRIESDDAHGPSAFSSVMDTVLPMHRVIGHVLFRDEEGRVLLLETSYKQDWELPGGVIEPGETPRIGAERELGEELGLDITLDQPIVVDWMPPYLGWSDAVEFIFDGGHLSDAQRERMHPADGEIRDYHWVDEADLDGLVTPLSARRIRLMLTRPSNVYIEDGRALH